jgi:VCBS repeat-containing protein
MRPVRLGVLIAPTLLAVLFLAPGPLLAQAQAPVGFSAPTSSAAGDSPVSVATGDFNADNDPDLAVANQFSSDVSVLLGGAAGSFSGPTSFPTGFFSNSVAVADFNADHDPDLAVANAAGGTVSVLLGGAGGGFTGPTDFAAGSPYVVAVGDFNGDGDPDLVVADHVAGDLSVLIGGPGGSFSGPTTIAMGTGTAAVAVGEFNQDGDPDLAVGDYGTGRVLVLLGGSGATFGSPTAVGGSGVDPISVAVGEFNQDGDPDLAVAEESGQLLVLLGGSGGGFGGTTAVLSGPQAEGVLSSVAVGDFNRDEDPDLVVAHRSGNRVRVLPGGPGGSFGSPTNFPTGTGPASVAVADFNADGKPDLTTANPTTRNVSVLLNTTVTNRAPTAAADSYSTAEDTTLTVAAPGVLGNDGDLDGDALNAALVSGPAHGSLTLNANGGFTYTPTADYNGNDSFTYRAGDGTLQSGPATVTITVTGANDGPTATGDTYSTAEDTALTVAAPGVLGNDSDPDGDSLSALVDSGPAHGSLALNPDGSFTYTPAADYNGTDSFTYEASDGSLSSNPTTVTIAVAAANDAPRVTVAAGGTCGTNDRSGTINLTVGDVESSAATLRLSAASSNPALVPNGNVAFGGSDAARTLTATAVAGRTGTAILTATVSDGQATGTVQVTVRVGGGSNDTLLGGPATNLIFGQNGTDTLTGGGGIDLVCGGNGDDAQAGGGGDDSLAGGAGNDRLGGGSGADNLSGGNGNDRLTGGPGPDRFSGGAGADTATDLSAAEGDTTDRTIP